MKKYKVLEDVAIADIAFEIYGKNLNELFENAALAIFEESADLSKVENKEKKSIKLKADNVEDLLYDFISEILFLKDKDSFLFKTSNVNIEKYSSMAQVALVKRQWDHRYFCSNILFFKSLDAKGSNLHFCPASAMIMPSQMVFLHFRGGLDEHNGQEPRHHDLCRFVNRQGGQNGLANRWQGSLIIACFFRSLPT